MKLFKNATFYTMEEENKKTNMVLTDKGVIIATGNDCLSYEPNEIVDLNGSYVFPGFTDAHMHLIGYGRKLLANVIKTNDVINEIKNFYNSEDLFVEGYFDSGLTKDDLDVISSDYMIILRHNDYHSFTVNSKVLEKIRFEHKTGILLEEDAKKVLPIWSNYSKELLEKMTNKAILSLYKYGITGVHTDDLSYFNSYQETLGILNEITKEYPFRINMLIHYDVFDEYIANYNIDNKYLKDIQVKLFYDGTISSKTALLKENYKNLNTNGLRMDSEKIFLEKIKKIRDNKHSVAIHTIGDLALSEVTNILIKYKNDNEMIDRIVHASLADMETINKLSKSNIALDIQPLFIESDKEIISENINHNPLIYPFKEYSDHCIILNGSSDAPVENPNPLLGIYHMGISRYESIKAYTVNPGITINDNIGMIKVGYKADFSAFSKDLMTISLEQLKENEVYATIIDEKIVYRNEEE
ncbi:amidohydrolase [Haploplasma axanthum]|uniref:Isoaspartyl dipeptidase n=1 Tax=Haploplasma axanthum TaxID=29552 RepID=A0A449BC68_HAPAX|nr:amidohydrolase family protein [Haploplasma axanthum]VEU80022.1 isoaspartyl dipeptidase [Haploplasma axanthum]